jgi:broad specificity polyphosphatase/5'/3'-nucleotidase SurE
MTITPKVVIKLFNKLKSQEILYNLNFPHSDSANTKAYCVAFNIKSVYTNANRLYFRRVDNHGWNLRDHNFDNHMIFDPNEIQNKTRNCYWCVKITPEVAKELLRQRKEYLKTQE